MTRILLSLFLLLLVPVPAQAAPGCPSVIMGNGPSLHPEGVTFDPVRRGFLIGSVTHGTVSRS